MMYERVGSFWEGQINIFRPHLLLLRVFQQEQLLNVQQHSSISTSWTDLARNDK